MPVISYDYFPTPHLKNGKLIAIYTPVVALKLSANYKMYPYSIKCLVDSGADFNLFPADIGEKLGLKIKKGEKVEHIGIGNVGITAYAHPVKIFVKEYSFKSEIHFSYDHKIPLLGREGFFKYFKKVIFNQKDLKLDLKYCG